MKQFFLTTSLVIFILTASVTAALNFRPLYHYDTKSLNISQSSGFSQKTIRENYDALIDYNCVFQRKPLSLTLPMSDQGRIHFEEVKHIFDIVQILCMFSLGFCLFVGFQELKAKHFRFLFHAAAASLALPAICTVFITVNWENAFTYFHKVFFRNNYWIFDETLDPIIKILPDTFFFHCALMIISLILLGSMLCFFFYSFFRHKFVL